MPTPQQAARWYGEAAASQSQRTRLRDRQRDILEALERPEPPRSYDFEPLND